MPIMHPDTVATDSAPPAEDGLGDPAWLSDTVAFGTVTLESGAPAAGVDVYVGIAEGVPGEPGDCSMPWGVKGLVRTAADGDGRWSTRIPRAERARPGCLYLVAEVRDTTGPIRDLVTAYAFLGAALDSMPVPIRLQTVRPVERDPREPVDPRPDFVWPLVSERIPGWAGWLPGAGGRCSAVVSLRDMRQQEAARAYVQAELDARRYPGDPPCERYDIEFEKVKFGWADLTRYAARTGHLIYFHGIEMSDLDEVANRVVYRFRYAEGARAARRALAAMRVPPEVVEILETEDAERAGRFGPETPRLGRLLADPDARSPAWSADGREVLSLRTDSGFVIIHAADAATGAIREVARTHTAEEAFVLRQAADGTLYAAVTPPEGTSSIHRVRPGRPPEPVHPLGSSPFEMDSAGQRFLFMPPPREGEEGDPVLAVWDAAARRLHRVPLAGSTYRMGLEPGGRAVVYEAWTGDTVPEHGVWTFDLRRRRATKLWSVPEPLEELEDDGQPPRDEPEVREMFAAVRWVEGRPRLLLSRLRRGAPEAELLELDPATGARTRLAGIPAEGSTRPPAHVAWTPDGRRAALWVTVGRDPPECMREMCAGLYRTHARLYLWEAGHDVRLLADVVKTAIDDEWLAFSPDGRRIGYGVDGRLYVHDLP